MSAVIQSGRLIPSRAPMMPPVGPRSPHANQHHLHRCDAHSISEMGQNENPAFSGFCQLSAAADITGPVPQRSLLPLRLQHRTCSRLVGLVVSVLSVAGKDTRQADRRTVGQEAGRQLHSSIDRRLFKGDSAMRAHQLTLIRWLCLNLG